MLARVKRNERLCISGESSNSHCVDFEMLRPSNLPSRNLCKELVLGMCTMMYEKQYLYQHNFFVLNTQ